MFCPAVPEMVDLVVSVGVVANLVTHSSHLGVPVLSLSSHLGVPVL